MAEVKFWIIDTCGNYFIYNIPAKDENLFIKYAGQVYEQWGHHSEVIHATKKQNEELLEKMRSDYSSDYCETDEDSD
tara:strand:+ start:20172 stop:20402 length:231 start_codon:yes stop_codon:yes gene_type:complete